MGTKKENPVVMTEELEKSFFGETLKGRYAADDNNIVFLTAGGIYPATRKEVVGKIFTKAHDGIVGIMEKFDKKTDYAHNYAYESTWIVRTLSDNYLVAVYLGHTKDDYIYFFMDRGYKFLRVSSEDEWNWVSENADEIYCGWLTKNMKSAYEKALTVNSIVERMANLRRFISDAIKEAIPGLRNDYSYSLDNIKTLTPEDLLFIPYLYSYDSVAGGYKTESCVDFILSDGTIMEDVVLKDEDLQFAANHIPNVSSKGITIAETLSQMSDLERISFIIIYTSVNDDFYPEKNSKSATILKCDKVNINELLEKAKELARKKIEEAI